MTKSRLPRRVEDHLVWSKGTLVLKGVSESGEEEFRYYAMETEGDGRFLTITKFPYESPAEGDWAVICTENRNEVLELNFNSFLRGKVDTDANRIELQSKEQTIRPVQTPDEARSEVLAELEECKAADLAFTKQAGELYGVVTEEEERGLSQDLQPLL